VTGRSGLACTGWDAERTLRRRRLSPQVKVLGRRPCPGGQERTDQSQDHPRHAHLDAFVPSQKVGILRRRNTAGKERRCWPTNKNGVFGNHSLDVHRPAVAADRRRQGTRRCCRRRPKARTTSKLMPSVQSFRPQTPEDVPVCTARPRSNGSNQQIIVTVVITPLSSTRST